MVCCFNRNLLFSCYAWSSNIYLSYARYVCEKLKSANLLTKFSSDENLNNGKLSRKKRISPAEASVSAFSIIITTFLCHWGENNYLICMLIQHHSHPSQMGKIWTMIFIFSYFTWQNSFKIIIIIINRLHFEYEKGSFTAKFKLMI